MRLTSRHKTALQLLFEGNYTIDEIAKIVKVSRQTLYNWQNDTDFKAAMKELEDDFDRKTRSRIRALVRGALERQERILTESRNDNAAAVVAKDVLDRAGFMPDSNVNIAAVGPVQIIDNIPDCEPPSVVNGFANGDNNDGT